MPLPQPEVLLARVFAGSTDYRAISPGSPGAPDPQHLRMSPFPSEFPSGKKVSSGSRGGGVRSPPDPQTFCALHVHNVSLVQTYPASCSGDHSSPMLGSDRDPPPDSLFTVIPFQTPWVCLRFGSGPLWGQADAAPSSFPFTIRSYSKHPGCAPG